MKKGQEDFVTPPSGDEGMQKKTHSVAPKPDRKLCMFCQKLTYKKDQKLTTVMTTDTGETIRNCANRKGDEVFLKKICSVNLIAQEAKYHKGCHSAYLKMKKGRSELEDEREDNDLYQAAFYELIKEINTDLLHNKRAYDMCTLLQEYKKILRIMASMQHHTKVRD